MTIVADVLPDVVKTMGRRSSDSFQRYRCSLGKITLNHTSAKAYKVIPSDLGVSLLRTILHSPWSFVRLFVHPSQVTICNGKYLFIYLFLSVVNSYDLSFPAVQVDNKLSKSNGVFSISHTVTSPFCTVVINIIIR